MSGMNKRLHIQNGSTLFLRLAVLGIGAAVLGLGILLFPAFWYVQGDYPSYAPAVYIVLTTIYLTTIPYFLGLFKAWSILKLIENGKAFTFQAAKKLTFVSQCAATISVLYLVSLPAFYVWADQDDAPGLMVIGLVFSTVPMVVAVCVAVLRRLLYEAIVIKNEHDMTV